jgi:hypothetical protein
MKENTTTQRVLFNDVFNKPVLAEFDQPDSSSDGGLILLKAADTKLALTRALAGCLRDRREPGMVIHSYEEQLRQRVFGLACGYDDCNDAARLVNDPMHKLAMGRDPQSDHSLASQPTLCRFENAIDSRSLLRMANQLADAVVQRHQQRLGETCRLITIDMDPTDDATHGSQQLTLFNGHYDKWCYLPLACFLSFNQEPDHYLFAYLLRPGDACATYGAIPILKRIIPRLRRAFPTARIRVRLDGGFASPDILEFLDDYSLGYAVAIPSNSCLLDHSEPLMEQARVMSEKAQQTEHLYGDCEYSAGSWDAVRRVVIKAEVVRQDGREPKDNPRFVVTNLKTSPKHIYEKVYCARGDVENRIKELLYGISIDRTSCHRFFANQFRGLLSAAAYVLMQELRLAAKGTVLEKAQVTTLREKLLKMAVWLATSIRRIVLRLPNSAPWRWEWQHVAQNLGAAPG